MKHQTHLRLDLTLFKIPLTLTADQANEWVFSGFTNFEQGRTAPALDEALQQVFKVFGLKAFLTTSLHLSSLYARLDTATNHLQATGVIELPNATAILFLDVQPNPSQSKLADFAVGLDLQYQFSLANLPILTKQIEENLRLSLAFANHQREVELVTAPNASPRKIRMNRGVTLKPNLEFPSEFFDFDYELMDFAASKPEAATNTSDNVHALRELPNQKATKWFEINKLVGPVHFRKIGMQWKDGKVWVLLNLDFMSAGLEFVLLGLQAGASLNLKEFKPSFDLLGIGVSFKNPMVEVGGALLKTDNLPPTYLGKMLFRLSKVSIGAVGGYGETATGERSFFALAAVNLPLGGTPAFYIKGIAAGFGYNTELQLPEAQHLPSFPLLNVSRLSGKSPSQALEILGQWVRPKLGEKWLAAGVHFSSFELIEANALLLYDFNQRQIAVLGAASLVLPKEQAAYLNLQFGLKAVYRMEQGALQSDARLAPGSFLIHRSVVLDGNVACYAWFQGEHAGDFVLSVGGYHPKFQPPAHYPKPNRVGFSWVVSETTQIVGNTYFALTSAAAMAGFLLDATYEKGNLKAWFNAQADMILQWKPFYYDFKTKIRLGASYNANLLLGTKNYKLDIGADLHLFGPPVGGYVEINWTVISFAIQFGNPEKAAFLYVLDWESFRKSFLPASSEEVCRPTVAQGLIKEIETEKEKIWVVRQQDLTFSTQSVIPSNRLIINGLELKSEENIAPLGIRPMNKQRLQSVQKVTIEKTNGGMVQVNFNTRLHLSKVSPALWSPKPLNRQQPENESMRAITGLDFLRPHQERPLGMDITQLSFFETTEMVETTKLTDLTDAIFNDFQEQADSLKLLADTLADATVIEKRRSLASTLNIWLDLSGNDCLTTDNLVKTAIHNESLFQSNPKIGQLTRIPEAVRAVTFPKVISREAVEMKPTPIKPAQLPVLEMMAKGYGRTAKMLPESLKNQLSQGVEAAKPAQLQAGTALVFNLDNRPHVENLLHNEGQLPLQIVAFDDLHQILDFTILKPEQKTTYPIPDATKRLAVKALPLHFYKEDAHRGWLSEDRFPIVHSNALLDDGILIQTQVPLETATGVTSMQEMTAKNRIQTTNNAPQNGYIDTIAFNGYREFVVIAKQNHHRHSDKEACLNAISVTIPYIFEENFQKTFKKSPQPLRPISYDSDAQGYVRLKFSLSKKKLKANGEWDGFAIRTQSAEGWTVKGVFFFKDRARKEGWLEEDLSDNSLIDNELAILSNAVWLEMKS